MSLQRILLTAFAALGLSAYLAACTPFPPEVRPPPPYAGAVWIDAHYSAVVDGWVWMPGYWK